MRIIIGRMKENVWDCLHNVYTTVLPHRKTNAKQAGTLFNLLPFKLLQNNALPGMSTEWNESLHFEFQWLIWEIRVALIKRFWWNGLLRILRCLCSRNCAFPFHKLQTLSSILKGACKDFPQEASCCISLFSLFQFRTQQSVSLQICEALMHKRADRLVKFTM